MPSLVVPPSGLTLDNAPSKLDTTRPDILSLTLSDNIIEDMIKCVRNGKGLQLSLGPDLRISYGSKIQHFSSSPDPFTHEIYQVPLSPSSVSSTSSDPQTSDEMRYIKVTPKHNPNFFGWAQKMMRPKKAGTGNASTTTAKPAKTEAAQFPDTALAQLESSLAFENAKKIQNTTKLVKDSSTLPPAVQQRASSQTVKSGNKNRFLSQSKSLGSTATRSMPTSPAPNTLSSPAIAPTSVPLSQQQAEKAKAIRSPIIHQLAIGPSTEEDLFKYKTSNSTDAEFRVAIEKVADSDGDGLWKLKTKSYKELEVWVYNYTSQEERQSAIDNAVRAYDKLRLNRSEPEWERLLPKEERGTGKCLSKLQAKIAINGNQQTRNPKSSTHRAEDSGRDTGAESNDDNLFSDKPSKSVLGGESMTRSHSQPSAAKPKKASEKEAQAKRLLAKPGKTSTPSTTKKLVRRSEKESTKFKSSEFVNDSDEDDDEDIPLSISKPNREVDNKKELPPKTTTKRPRDDADIMDNTTPFVKKSKKDEATSSSASIASTASKHRISDASQTSRSTTATSTSFTTASSRSKVTSTSPQKSSPLASSPPTNATDMEDSYQTSSSNSPYKSSHAQIHQTLKRKSDNSIDEPPVKRHQKTSSSSTSSSTSSTWDHELSAEIREKSARFKVYYDKYAQLHKELSEDESRRRKEISVLLDMQERLAKMKREILRGAGA